MIPIFFFEGYEVAVLGLGKSGIAAAQALMKSGAEVWAWDDNEDARQKARELDIPLVDLHSCNLDDLTTLVLSPGIPHTFPEPHPVVTRFREAGLEVVCDIELLARAMRDSAYIGVTGTNGKSTTTALLGHILQLSGRDCEVGGNLGQPALSLNRLDENGIYLLEMSSYQLELVPSITFDFAVLLNIGEDHLDRHGGMEGYIAAKRRVFHRQTSPRAAIIGVDDPVCRRIYDELKAVGDQMIIPVSVNERIHGGVYVIDGWLYDDMDGKEVQAINLNDLPQLPGKHNWQNAAAAYATARSAGVPAPTIGACMRSFQGLPHRQEIAGLVDGVLYINDSKGTNAEAASKALGCYQTIYWIAGGRAKEGGITSLAPWFPRIRKAFLIGESAEAFAGTLGDLVPFEISGTLETAVAHAREQALADGETGAVVLLSPACASWDQFRSFEHRGDTFCDLVDELPGERETLDGYSGGMQ